MIKCKYKQHKFAWSLTAVLVWMGIIFMFSAQPGNDSSKLSDGIVTFLSFLFFENEWLIEHASFLIRKGAHMSEYAILAILLMLMWSQTKWRHQRFPNALLCAFLYACTDEIHQLFVPGRAGLFQDVMIDIMGAMLGLLFYGIANHLYQYKKRQSDNKDAI